MDLITDRNMAWKRKRETIWAVNSPGFSANTPVGVHSGAPVWTEVSTLGFAGMIIDAAGDEYVHYYPLPADCDVDQPIYMRILYTTIGQTAADTQDWIITYIPVAHGEVLAAATTALNTIIANDDAGATTLNFLITAWGFINASVLTEGDVLIIEVECNATGVDVGDSEDVLYLGMEVEYSPRKMWGTEVLPEAKSN